MRRFKTIVRKLIRFFIRRQQNPIWLICAVILRISDSKDLWVHIKGTPMVRVTWSSSFLKSIFTSVLQTGDKKSKN